MISITAPQSSHHRFESNNVVKYAAAAQVQQPHADSSHSRFSRRDYMDSPLKLHQVVRKSVCPLPDFLFFVTLKCFRSSNTFKY